MPVISFIDVEVEPGKGRVLDIGCINELGSQFHQNSVPKLIQFLQDTEFVCGHNLLQHDFQYIREALDAAEITEERLLDTLFLSPLLFPTKPYHALVKDDKLQSDELNNPLNDAIKARQLLDDEVSAFNQAEEILQDIYYGLLKDTREFRAFFRFIRFEPRELFPEILIRKHFGQEICARVNLKKLAAEQPIGLAYSIALLNAFITNRSIHSVTPPWVLKSYPETEHIMFQLRNNPCLEGCSYCEASLDKYLGMKKFFGFDTFRIYGDEPLQEKAVQAAIRNRSLLAVFPTGGGKSITFQLPALMSGENVRGLTVIISPLQSLMKDQVDNLEKAGITEAVTINGLLDPIERAKSFERVENGSASLLYISPESLRSKSIERLILSRKIVRFVIDEAHCFSSWGQDFRVDYLYIGDFIKQIQQKKNLPEGIPVSCFTATAKQKVIEDICAYFRTKLSLELDLFTAKSTRNNLHYKVLEKVNDEEKYQSMRLLIEANDCPTIVYVSRTYRAYKLAERLNEDGFTARPYHGKMETAEKTANQNAFIYGEVSIMVATSAFGMGVDKKDVGMVIHYDISDSLENYVQEAGRAGRDEMMQANCYILFNEEDLSKHFILLNQTKITHKEIQQVWKAIKDLSRFRTRFSNSALEIARKAGWDDTISDMDTRVTTAIAALEDSGYLKRGQNMPRIYANSILSKTLQEAADKIRSSTIFEESQKEKALRILKKLFSSKRRIQEESEIAESRIDYISDHLGIVKAEVIQIINQLREEKILADTKDLTAYIRKGENKNRSLQILESFGRMENFLLSLINQEEIQFSLKELNEKAEMYGCDKVSILKIKTIFNFWTIKQWIKQQYHEYSRNHISIVSKGSIDELKEKAARRHNLSRFVSEYLFTLAVQQNKSENDKEDVLVQFSVHELKDEYLKTTDLFGTQVTLDDVEDTLFFLSRIGAIKIEGGFLVVYNQLTIERIEEDNYKKYTRDDYKKLSLHYENKIQQIHIVGEYAKKMIQDYKDALQFVEDYFQLHYSSFLRKHFPGSKTDDLRLKMTPGKYRQLFGELSPTQLKIIKDNDSKYIAVTAGPGSGKTRILVHKLASLLLMEDVKHEQLLMLTFSRAAATEFKKRLFGLIQNAAAFVEIKTFHSYCFDLLGRVGNLEKSGSVIRATIEKINAGEVEINRITKTVLVIDEAQDMDPDEFNLILTLMKQNEDMRVIAVGDDDQNIYEFRGSSSKYLESFIKENQIDPYELVENYRSKSNLVEFSNQWVQQIKNRLKATPVFSSLPNDGKLKLVRYQSKHLAIPLVNDILQSGLSGTTCVLTQTNDEAAIITGLLLRKGVHTRLIQTNDQFNLYHLSELRYFLNRVKSSVGLIVIQEDDWQAAKIQLVKIFDRSNQLELCLKLIQDFEITHPKKKYLSDFESFIRESALEDFITEQGETILVSTMHKSKGREFDHVFLLLEDFKPESDEAKRLLYVAMTRARKELNIHVNGHFLDPFLTPDFNVIDDATLYQKPEQLLLNLTHKDVQLGYFQFVQRRMADFQSGDILHKHTEGYANRQGELVLKFSKKFVDQLNHMIRLGYAIKQVKIRCMVYWRAPEDEKEVLIILPEVTIEK